MTSWESRLRPRSSGSISSAMASNDKDSTAFKLSLQESLLDLTIVEHYQKIFKPMLAPIQDALHQSNQLVDSLRKQIQAKDEEITILRSEVTNLKVKYDNLEQHGRRGSMRIFGVPEHTKGTVDDKVLRLVNSHLTAWANLLPSPRSVIPLMPPNSMRITVSILFLHPFDQQPLHDLSSWSLPVGELRHGSWRTKRT